MFPFDVGYKQNLEDKYFIRVPFRRDLIFSVSRNYPLLQNTLLYSNNQIIWAQLNYSYLTKPGILRKIALLGYNYEIYKITNSEYDYVYVNKKRKSYIFTKNNFKFWACIYNESIYCQEAHKNGLKSSFARLFICDQNLIEDSYFLWEKLFIQKSNLFDYFFSLGELTNIFEDF